MKARERKLSMVLFLCIGFLFLAFLGLFIYPTYQNMSDKADEQTQQKNIAEAQLKEAKSLDPDEVNAKLANLKSRIPSSLELPNVINRLTELAKDSNLIWLSGAPADASTSSTATPTDTTVPGDTAQSTQLDVHDFTIVVSGNMNDVVKFMEGLSNKKIGRVIVINSLGVQYKPEAGDQAVEATIKLQVIGWKSGSLIDSAGCAQASAAGGDSHDSDDPKCNTTDVNKD